ncbi:oxidoreductase [Pseudovibrio sp. Alg231-02]|uniref:oxidoreductase n=1 Tax=Pseudovibrio sp. Alg231-02 TaxID=1922223 RepID=UPI000D54C54A|nr:oxidoreductase [Pseudovibrio sp. Alg231-02]
MSSVQPVKTALVGFGVSGQSFHAPLLTFVEGIDLAAVVSSKPDLVKSKLPDCTPYTSFEDVLAQPDIELVVLSLPNTLHHDHAKKALLAGKHVVVEKPFTITSAEAEELIEITEQKDLKLSVYHNRRFDCDFLTLQDLMETGRLGKVHSYLCNYNRYRPDIKGRWREQDIPGAGILYDLGAHGIDQALSLFGTPKSVQAKLRVQRKEAAAVDHFHLVLGYDDCDVILHGNCLSTEQGPRFQVSGDKATYITYGMDPQEDMLKAGGGPASPTWGVEAEDDWGTLYNETGEGTPVPSQKGGYERFYAGMRDAIRNDTAVPVSPRDAMQTIRIIEAAYLSEKETRTVLL